MTMMPEPISGEDLLGYMSAMSADLPLGDPLTVIE